MPDVPRCDWAGTDPVYIAYHDKEWGEPIHNDTKLFEMLILEGFQAGLSWLTILKRREGFRSAFAGWDWERVARFTDRDRGRLREDTGIIRNRLKIDAAIRNAQAFITVREQFGTFDSYLWSFTDNTTLVPEKRAGSFGELPVTTPESDALSKDLKKRGFSFVGSTICYAYMQAIGMVDDHQVHCFKAKH